jgi:hypothetical protein
MDNLHADFFGTFLFQSVSTFTAIRCNGNDFVTIIADGVVSVLNTLACGRGNGRLWQTGYQHKVGIAVDSTKGFGIVYAVPFKAATQFNFHTAASLNLVTKVFRIHCQVGGYVLNSQHSDHFSGFTCDRSVGNYRWTDECSDNIDLFVIISKRSVGGAQQQGTAYSGKAYKGCGTVLGLGFH